MISLAQTRMPRPDARHFYILVTWIPCYTLVNWRSLEGDMSRRPNLSFLFFSHLAYLLLVCVGTLSFIGPG